MCCSVCIFSLRVQCFKIVTMSNQNQNNPNVNDMQRSIDQFHLQLKQLSQMSASIWNTVDELKRQTFAIVSAIFIAINGISYYAEYLPTYLPECPPCWYWLHLLTSVWYFIIPFIVVYWAYPSCPVNIILENIKTKRTKIITAKVVG
jgi:hypothetical protein